MTLYLSKPKCSASLYLIVAGDDPILTDNERHKDIMFYHKWSAGNLMDFRVESLREY